MFVISLNDPWWYNIKHVLFNLFAQHICTHYTLSQCLLHRSCWRGYWIGISEDLFKTIFTRMWTEEKISQKLKILPTSNHLHYIFCKFARDANKISRLYRHVPNWLRQWNVKIIFLEPTVTHYNFSFKLLEHYP